MTEVTINYKILPESSGSGYISPYIPPLVRKMLYLVPSHAIFPKVFFQPICFTVYGASCLAKQQKKF